MTVFVDDMYKYPMGQFRTRSGRIYKMSHLIATTEPELHRMAKRIGVARQWFQEKPSGNHYDITMSKRKLAIEYGALEVTMVQLISICWCLKHKVRFDSPEHAEKLRRKQSLGV